MPKKVVIVGGVAGGASAAARLRRLDETAEIIMLERDEYISFANCGLPYHISEVIQERSNLIVQSPAAMKSRFNIDVRTFSEVVGVDTARKVVKIDSVEKGQYEESYDVLILSPGAEPFIPSGIGGTDLPQVMSLRNIPDTDRIKAEVDKGNIKKAVVVGGGFIGLEMTENLRERGIDVTLIEAANHVMPPLDDDMAMILEKELDKHGVHLVLGDGIADIKPADGGVSVSTQSGKTFPADLVIMAIGVRPATAFLSDSDIKLGARGHIIVDKQLRTNAPEVYAVGDAIEVTDFVTGDSVGVPLASPANKQGRIVADIICGEQSGYESTQGTSIIKVFGLAGAATGVTERRLKAKGISYHKAIVHPFSHATYYPGSVQITAKMLFDDKGTILGCQMVGSDSVDKRMDVMATAMRLGAKATDLPKLELAYAPPFSSAKDPVNMLGYVAENVLSGKSKLVDWDYALARNTDTTILLDVRTPKEFAQGHPEGSINIPVDELRARLSELDKSKEIIEFCRVGIRAHVAYCILAQNGFDVRNVTGGYISYEQMQFVPKA